MQGAAVGQLRDFGQLIVGQLQLDERWQTEETATLHQTYLVLKNTCFTAGNNRSRSEPNRHRGQASGSGVRQINVPLQLFYLLSRVDMVPGVGPRKKAPPKKLMEIL